MTANLVDLFCRSFAIPPGAITLDIDDICDRAHGHQQLSLADGTAGVAENGCTGCIPVGC